jgi:NAD(P)-dependent dehydrogenase (short-subunit alcohol dehydrogenase family)
MDSINEQVAIVTGADRGIGKSVVARLWDLGWRKFLLHSKDGQALKETYSADEWAGSEIELAHGDVSDTQSVEDAVAAAVQRFGRIDALFNVAGVAYPGGILDSSLEHWDASWMTNVRGFLNFARATAPAMKSRASGHIVNLSSIWAIQPSTALAPYSVSKHAVQGLSGAMQAEFQPHGIKVSTVILDKVNTNFRENMPGPDFPQERLELMLTPDEVARIIVGLTETDANTNISTLQIDAWRWQ